MPSSPKILKEAILETAFTILLRDGYEEVNIKNIAKELNCSTQPISRQFGNMENFRKALFVYCVDYVNQRFALEEEAVEAVIENIAKRYIEIAYDTPKLYKYLYMGGQEGGYMQRVSKEMRRENHQKVLAGLVAKYNISQEAAERYLENINYYVHGMAAYVAVGQGKLTKQELMDRIHEVSDMFLAGEQK